MSTLTPQEAEEFWGIADKNGDGSLTIHEMKAALKTYIQQRKGSLPDDRTIARMFSDIDKSGDGKISKAEFLSDMVRQEGRSEELKSLFTKYDKSGDGELSRDEIQALLKEAGCYGEEAVDEIITQCDKNTDGQISFKEFEKACC